jgi:SAM-dependent methyltransferase
MRELELDPYGLDLSSELIALARQRFPGFDDHFRVANAWMWAPPRRFDYVYTLYDNVPLDYLAEYIRQLLGNVVAAGGRLVVGAYGSRTRHEAAFDVAEFMNRAGFSVAGSVSAGAVPEARFAWIEATAKQVLCQNRKS